MKKLEEMTPEQLTQYLNLLMGATQEVVPPGCGIVILITDERPSVHYVSNGLNREQAMKMLFDVGNKLKAGILTEPDAREPETGPFAGWSDSDAWRLVDKRMRDMYDIVGHRTKLIVEELGRLASFMLKRLER